MNLQQALQQLEELGTAQNRKVYARHGVNPNMFGVSYRQPEQAGQVQQARPFLWPWNLWATGNHDARVLATMVADPSQAGESLLDQWLGDLDSYVITDAFSGFVGKTGFGSSQI